MELHPVLGRSPKWGRQHRPAFPSGNEAQPYFLVGFQKLVATCCLFKLQFDDISRNNFRVPKAKNNRLVKERLDLLERVV